MIVTSILQMVISVTPARTLLNAGGSLLGSSKPGGRGKVISSSKLVSTMPAPRLFPSITFLPTFALSGSVPVLTGQRSDPGLSSGAGAATAAHGAAWGAPPVNPHACLILAATLGLTTGRAFTSVIGPPSDGGVGGKGPGGIGG